MDTLNKKKISVVIPAFNEARFVRKNLDSLLGQSSAEFRLDYEIIVVDDGSTDDTARIVKEYPVQLIQLGGNRGKIEARKIGAEAAKYDILLLIDVRAVASSDLLYNFWQIRRTPLMAGRNPWFEKEITHPEQRFFYLLRRRYYYPNFPSEKDADKEEVHITRDNFNKIPKGTTCLFIDKRLFLEATPKKYSRYTNDDTKLFAYIVFDKGITIAKHRRISFSYICRSNPRELARMVARRGITFFDFYIQRYLKFKVLFILAPVFIAAVIYYCVLNSGNILYVLSCLIAVYLAVSGFLCERFSDLKIVLPRLWKYSILFYLGTLRGLFAKVFLKNR